MKIGLYTNTSRDTDLKVTNKLIEQIKRYSSISYNLVKVNNKIAIKDSIHDQKELIKNSDILIIVGGDGTTLSCILNAAKLKVPILGINAGRLGFLSEINENDLNFNNIIEKLHKREYLIENRIMIEGKSPDLKHPIHALNEIILCKSQRTSVANLKIFIGNILADVFTGDGLMVATPTGSTAYSLSCQGPILSTDVDALVVNSLSPHTLHGRPMVVSASSLVTLEIAAPKNDIDIIYDGNLISLNKNVVKLDIKKSKLKSQFIKFKNTNFYNTLLKKLNVGNEKVINYEKD